MKKEETMLKTEGHTWPETKRHPTDWNDDDILEALQDMLKGKMNLGETPSAGMVSNARSLSKLASSMSLNDGQWMDTETWDAFHACPKPMREELMLDLVSNYTQSGIQAFDMATVENFRKQNNQEVTISDRQLHEMRSGFFGWMGFGGSVFQWNPEYKVGFSYVPTDLFLSDLANNKAAKL